VHACLNEMDKTPYEKLKGTSLLTISTHPKIFSNGLDIGNFKSERDVAASFHDLMQMCAWFLTLKIPSVSYLYALDSIN